jgi:hypothetical protein
MPRSGNAPGNSHDGEKSAQRNVAFTVFKEKLFCRGYFVQQVAATKEISAKAI